MKAKDNNIKVVVGMSGGVDSGVSAALLKEQGYEVTGVFMECWRGPGCRVEEDRKDALDVALQLGIPFEVLDFRQEYKERVVDYFVREYRAGRTPNPDVMCNREIKFGMFYEEMIGKRGYDFIATGHYARVGERGVSSPRQRAGRQESGVRKLLLRGVDEKKDQSYFLYQLREEQLAHILFPIGGMTKKQVRQKAKGLGLPVAGKPDSQGICFVGEVRVDEFLKDLGVREKRGGVFLRSQGSVVGSQEMLVEVGEHKGAWFYTVGQRIGLQKLKTDNVKQKTNSKDNVNNLRRVGINPSNIPPLYVIEKDVERNVLVVGTREECMRGEFELSQIHWIDGRDPIVSLPSISAGSQDDHSLSVRIRHGGELVKVSEVQEVSKVSKVSGVSGDLRVVLEKTVFGVAPGQACVFYDGEVCLGGGVIV